jgi:hypothetical protein
MANGPFYRKPGRCISFVLMLVAVLPACRSGSSLSGSPNGDEYRTLLNDQHFSGWVNIPGSKESWKVDRDYLISTGTPHGYLRSQKQYEHFILEFDSKSAVDSGAIMIHADPLPAVGQPLPRGILCKLGVANTNFVIPVNGATIKTAEQTSERQPVTAAAGRWNHYRIESLSGGIMVSINGVIVSKDARGDLQKGYIAFISNGHKQKFRNIRIKELPSSTASFRETAETDQGFRSLYNGADLGDWDLRTGHQGHWTARDWVINYDGRSEEKDKCLWSKKEYADFILIADVRLTRKPEPAPSPIVLPNGEDSLNKDGSKKQADVPYAGDTGIYLRGNSKSQVNIGYRYIGSGEIYGYRVDKTLPADVRAAVTPKIKADKFPGEWNRFIITLKGERVTITLNNITVVQDALLPGIPKTGRIALQDDHADNNTFQFANLFIKELP